MLECMCTDPSNHHVIQAELRSMQASRDDTLHECVEMVAKDQASIRETLRQVPGICKDATAELVKEQVSIEVGAWVQ